jgi:hypothetical protein
MRNQATTALYDAFATWLDGFLSVSLPNDVVAFVFNLYEGEFSFDVQLDGCPSFDASSDSWTSNRIFSTGEDLFAIPYSFVDNWESALDVTRQLIRRYFAEGSKAAVLKKARAVACGFADGDLELVPNA